MARRDDIGGFYYGLGIDVDQGSFARAKDAIGGLKNAALAAFAAIGGMTAMKADLNTLRFAEVLGVGAEELVKWKTAASMAGVSSQALIQDMMRLETTMQQMKLGNVDEAMAKHLGMLGIDYGKFAEMKADERIKLVFKAAKAMGDQQKAALLVGHVLGQSGKDLYLYSQMTGKSLDEILTRAGGLTFSDEEGKRSAAGAYSELMGLISSIKGIGGLFMGEISKAIGPATEKINNWIIENNENIKNGIKKAFGAMHTAWDTAKEWIASRPVDWDKVLGTSFEIFTTGLGIVLDHAEKIAGHIAEIFKVLAGLGSAIFNGAKSAFEFAQNKIDEGFQGLIDISEKMNSSDNWFIQKFVQGSTWLGNKLQPGIGTQDNLLTGAGSLVPAAAGAGGNTANVTVNQNINLNGNAMPSQVREAAYQGTKSAMGETFDKTAATVQLMPGLK